MCCLLQICCVLFQRLECMPTVQIAFCCTSFVPLLMPVHFWSVYRSAELCAA
jgi:hypothetical protein